MKKGERGGGRGTFLDGGQAFAPVLGLDIVAAVVWLLLLSCGVDKDLDIEVEDAWTGAEETMVEEKSAVKNLVWFLLWEVQCEEGNK